MEKKANEYVDHSYMKVHSTNLHLLLLRFFNSVLMTFAETKFKPYHSYSLDTNYLHTNILCQKRWVCMVPLACVSAMACSHRPSEPSGVGKFKHNIILHYLPYIIARPALLLDTVRHRPRRAYQRIQV